MNCIRLKKVETNNNQLAGEASYREGGAEGGSLWQTNHSNVDAPPPTNNRFAREKRPRLEPTGAQRERVVVVGANQKRKGVCVGGVGGGNILICWRHSHVIQFKKKKKIKKKKQQQLHWVVETTWNVFSYPDYRTTPPKKWYI